MTLRPITDATPDPAAIRAALGPPASHFGRRAVDRGVLSIPGDALRLAIEWAVAEGREDLAAFVFQQRPGVRLFRFLVAEGPFYALVAEDGRAMTVYTRDMIRAERYARRGRKRRRGSRMAAPR